ncbi:hypothetical protein [Amycolatopsis sp. 195334CR]|uniref:hypothetical protein n=1 Tax=Amycolatopsis sp. 195334CR TaxID=2814588 RepID=UPI001A8C2980|nr:hypothetical protein [Amycolatopsis sp. 195334CR]MBN6040031.1 hypothetical protein [Amycolatopsis sp. 195334CR]
MAGDVRSSRGLALVGDQQVDLLLGAGAGVGGFGLVLAVQPGPARRRRVRAADSARPASDRGDHRVGSGDRTEYGRLLLVQVIHEALRNEVVKLFAWLAGFGAGDWIALAAAIIAGLAWRASVRSANAAERSATTAEAALPVAQASTLAAQRSAGAAQRSATAGETSASAAETMVPLARESALAAQASADAARRAAQVAEADRADREMAQARLVEAEVQAAGEHRTSARVVVANHSAEPIFQLQVTEICGAPHRPLYPVRGGFGEPTAPVTVKGSDVVEPRIGEGRNQAGVVPAATPIVPSQYTVVVRFLDSHGLRWERHGLDTPFRIDAHGVPLGHLDPEGGAPTQA